MAIYLVLQQMFLEHSVTIGNAEDSPIPIVPMLSKITDWKERRVVNTLSEIEFQTRRSTILQKKRRGGLKDGGGGES